MQVHVSVLRTFEKVKRIPNCCWERDCNPCGSRKREGLERASEWKVRRGRDGKGGGGRRERGVKGGGERKGERGGEGGRGKEREGRRDGVEGEKGRGENLRLVSGRRELPSWSLMLTASWTMSKKEHNQETEREANLGAQRRRKIVIDRRGEFTVWKAIMGFWTGSFKDSGRSGCGVITGVDRENWWQLEKLQFLWKWARPWQLTLSEYACSQLSSIWSARVWLHKTSINESIESCTSN